MLACVVDTNVLVRFLINDISDQRTKAREWLKDAEAGKLNIFVPALVVAETVFVLRVSYKMPFFEISEALEALVNERWLEVEDRELVNLALKFSADGRHFVDSYLLALNQIFGYEILTFDKKLKKHALNVFK